MTPHQNHRAVYEAVIKTLLYYDIFHYPLRSAEVYRFLSIKCFSEEEITNVLERLVDEQHIFKTGEFYSVQPCEELVERRLKGNALAEKCFVLAQSRAALIGSFPYVKAVFASGSLSKHYMDEKSDLDFFIITEPNRLWIVRMLLVVYKKMFLGNSFKEFCVNYFIDTDHLEIEEKNIFTATELATVIPLYDSSYHQALLSTNVWINSFFPNYTLTSPASIIEAKPTLLKQFFQTSINCLGGNVWERICQRLTMRRWKKYYADQYDKKDFDVAFKSKQYASKNHPNHYQRKVVDLHEKKIKEFFERFPIKQYA